MPSRLIFAAVKPGTATKILRVFFSNGGECSLTHTARFGTSAVSKSGQFQFFNSFRTTNLSTHQREPPIGRRNILLNAPILPMKIILNTAILVRLLCISDFWELQHICLSSFRGQPRTSSCTSTEIPRPFRTLEG